MKSFQIVETLSTNDQLATYTKILNQFVETIIAKAKTKLENNPLLFSLKSNGLFSSFVFATVLVALIALEANNSRAVKIHSQHFYIFIRVYVF